MRKVIAPGINCWQAFLSCAFDQDPIDMSECSTMNDNWAAATNDFLAGRGLFFVEVSANVAGLQNGALVGAHIQGRLAPHIVIAKVRKGPTSHRFEIWHDPAGKLIAGIPIEPIMIVLFCRLDKNNGTVH